MTDPVSRSPASSPADPGGSSPPAYSSVEREYHALRTGAIVVDRSVRSRATFAGARAAEALNGLVTNDVISLAPGSGCYAAALTPKGKILADLRLFVRNDDILVDVPPRSAAGWWGMIRKFVNPRLAKYSDVSSTLASIEVYGTHASELTAKAVGVSPSTLAALPPFGHLALTAWETTITVARVPDLGLAGFVLFVPSALRATVWDALHRLGAEPAGTDAFEIARIEAGRPEWGVEMDDSTLVQEANLDALHAVSYTKGCYTGQETVARVHFRGHVNRHLRGLMFGDEHVAAREAELVDGEGKVIGDVRSVAMSPRLGAIGMAMVRREVAVDAEVQVRRDGAVGGAQVVGLPFPLD